MQCMQTPSCLQLWMKTRLLPGMEMLSQIWDTLFHWMTTRQKTFSLCIPTARDRHHQEVCMNTKDDNCMWICSSTYTECDCCTHWLLWQVYQPPCRTFCCLQTAGFLSKLTEMGVGCRHLRWIPIQLMPLLSTLTSGKLMYWPTDLTAPPTQHYKQGRRSGYSSVVAIRPILYTELLLVHPQDCVQNFPGEHASRPPKLHTSCNYMLQQHLWYSSSHLWTANNSFLWPDNFFFETTNIFANLYIHIQEWQVK